MGISYELMVGPVWRAGLSPPVFRPIWRNLSRRIGIWAGHSWVVLWLSFSAGQT